MAWGIVYFETIVIICLLIIDRKRKETIRGYFKIIQDYQSTTDHLLKNNDKLITSVEKMLNYIK